MAPLKVIKAVKWNFVPPCYKNKFLQFFLDFIASFYRASMKLLSANADGALACQYDTQKCDRINFSFSFIKQGTAINTHQQQISLLKIYWLIES